MPLPRIGGARAGAGAGGGCPASHRFSDLTIAAPISSRFDAELYPTEVLVKAPEGGLENDSVVLLNQIRAIGKHRLGRRPGSLHPSTMTLVNEALAVSVGLADI